MKMTRTLLLAALLLAMATLPASADAPQLLAEWETEYVWAIEDDNPDWNCDGNAILDHIYERGSVKLWLNEHGKSTKLVIESSGRDNLFTEAHPEIVLHGNFGWTATFTDYNGGTSGDPFLEWDTVLIRGVDWNLHVPGQGLVFHNVGQGLFSWLPDMGHEEVKFTGLEVFDVPALCKALGF